METTGSRLLLAALEAHGIDAAFGYPGGTIMPFYDALPQAKGLRHFLVRHEQGAAFAAGAYARTTGRIGVCVATSGPGATNLVTGLLDAMMDSVPVLAITGQVRSVLLGTDGFQEADVVGITGPCTKHNVLVRRAAEIPAAVERAIRIATSGRPGPVLVDIPTDILKERLTWEGPLRSAAAAPSPAPAPSAETRLLATEAIAALARAERPVVIVGGGTRIAGVVNEFRRLARLVGAPVVATINGLGTPDPIDDYYLGMFGMHGHKVANLAVTRADCMIALGMRFDDRVTGDPSKFGRDATIIHCDIDPSEIGKIIPADIGIVGDLRTTMQALTEVAEVTSFPSYEAWRGEIQTLRRPLPRARTEASELSATDVLDALSAMMEPGTVVTTDVGQHQMWTAQRVRLESSRDFLTSAGLGAMGFGIPAAVGAQVARPEARVVAVVGDGGFQMTMHELATIRRYELPVKIVVVDNRHLGMVRQWQELFYDRRIVATDLYDNPDFRILASAYGMRSGYVDRPEDLHAALREMLECDTSYLLHCACFPTENCFPMVPAGQHIDEMLERTPA